MSTPTIREEILLFICRIIREDTFIDTITLECPKIYEPNFLLRFYHVITAPNSSFTADDIYCRKYTDVGWRYDTVRYEINCLNPDKTASILERVMAVGIANEALPIVVMPLLVDESNSENKRIKKDGTRFVKLLKNIIWEEEIEITTETDMAFVYALICEYVFNHSAKWRVQNGK